MLGFFKKAYQKLTYSEPNILYRCEICKTSGPIQEVQWIGPITESITYEEGLRIVSWVTGRHRHDEKTFQLYFHPSCVEKAICQPETYSIASVDAALEIVDRLETQRLTKRIEDKAAAEAAVKRQTKINAACRKVQGGNLLLD